MGLPCDFHDEADGHAGILIGTAEHITYIKLLAGQFVFCQLLDFCPDLRGHRVVVIFVTFGGPPYGVLGGLVHDDVFILGGAAGINSGHDIDGTELGQHALVITLKRGIHFILKELLVPGVINNLGSTGNAIFGEIKFGHSCINFLPKEFANNIAHSRLAVNENEKKNQPF